MHEEFRQVSGYEGKYEVSNLGNVRSIKNGLLKPTKKNDKLYVTLYGNGYKSLFNPRGGISKKIKVKSFEIGYLVALAFKKDSRIDEKRAWHIDGNEQNNKVENVMWKD